MTTEKGRGVMRGVLLAALVAMSLPGTAFAELYISPIIRETVTFDADAEGGDPGLAADEVTGESVHHGRFRLTRKDSPDPVRVMAFGHNVPLFVALEHVVPNSERWSINIDALLAEDMPVNWEGGETWEGVLTRIESENALQIAINQAEHAIGVSRDRRVAAALAYPEPRAWRTDASRNLEENLRDWLSGIGYKLVWHESIRDVSYPIVSSTVLYGTMFGNGGILDRVMNLTNRHDSGDHLPLAAKAWHGDRVVVVHRANYKTQLQN